MLPGAGTPFTRPRVRGTAGQGKSHEDRTRQRTCSQYLSDSDARVIAHCLKSLPTRQLSGAYTPLRSSTLALADGNRIRPQESLRLAVYQSFCAHCHGADGTGIERVFPKLAGNPAVRTEDTTSGSACSWKAAVVQTHSPAPPRQTMPGFAGQLADVDIAQVLTYVRSAWGNDAQPITATDVGTLRGQIHK
jgi:cytochrome c553